jgi:hypothetical protein
MRLPLEESFVSERFSIEPRAVPGSSRRWGTLLLQPEEADAAWSMIFNAELARV